VDVRQIDPRIDQRWESPPIHEYRVIFWRTSGTGWAADENDISGAADVHQVIQWADAQAAERGGTYTLYAKLDQGDQHGLVWLAGVDPTVGSGPNYSPQHP